MMVFTSVLFAVQVLQRYIFNATEHGSQRVLRITVDWMRILQQYSYTRGYVWNQYIPLDVNMFWADQRLTQYMQL